MVFSISGVSGSSEGEKDVEGFVDDLGERMGLIDGERGEDGRDLGVEVVLGPGSFGFGELGGGAEVDVLFREEGNELLVPAAVLVVDEVVGGGADAFELLARREAVEAEIGGTGVGLLDEAGDADLEEFVEIRADDREEFDALEEGIGVALGLLEDATVEVEPALLAVGVEGAVFGCGGARDGFAGGSGDARLARAFRGGLGHAKKRCCSKPRAASGLAGVTETLHDARESQRRAGVEGVRQGAKRSRVPLRDGG